MVQRKDDRGLPTIGHAQTYGRTRWSCRFLRPPLDKLFPGRRQPGARQALFTFTILEALSIADRFMPSAVKPDIQASLQLSDVETTYPDIAMKIVFMVSSFFFGYLADKQVCDRRILLASAVAVWSLATASGCFAQNLTQLILLRSLVGVGVGAFTTISTPMLADFYPPVWRNRAYTIFGLAAPFGAALGFGAGSVVDTYTGWRYAFMVCGLPGIIISFAVLALNDPPTGINDEDGDEKPKSPQSDGESSVSSLAAYSACKEYGSFLKNPHWLLASCGLVAIQFAIGGLTEWYPSYMSRVLHMPRGFSGLVLAGTLTIGGIAGTLLGSVLSDMLFSKCGFRSYLLVPALFTIPATIFVCLAVNVHIKLVVLTSLLLGQVCFFTYTAPLNAWCISVVPPATRGRAAALQNMLLHILGDLLSSGVVGAVSDATGNLQAGMQITYVSIAVAGLFWTFGWGCLKETDVFKDEDRQRIRRKTLRHVLFQASVDDIDSAGTKDSLPVIPEATLSAEGFSTDADSEGFSTQPAGMQVQEVRPGHDQV